MKITAVLLAVILWFFVTSRGQSEIAFDAPIEFKDIPAEIGIVSASAKMVSVTVRGQERMIKNLKRTEVRVFVDVSRAKKGEAAFPITSADIKLPYGMTVSGLSPGSVKVKFDEIVSKTIRVQPTLTGTPEQGMAIALVSVSPRSVTLKGLKSEVKRLQVVRTEQIDISQISETEEFEAALDLGGMSVISEPGSVKVQVVVAGRKR